MGLWVKHSKGQFWEKINRLKQKININFVSCLMTVTAICPATAITLEITLLSPWLQMGKRHGSRGSWNTMRRQPWIPDGLDLSGRSSWSYFVVITTYNRCRIVHAGGLTTQGLMQKRRNYSALAMELRLFCIKASLCELNNLPKVLSKQILMWSCFQYHCTAAQEPCVMRGDCGCRNMETSDKYEHDLRYLTYTNA